MENNNNNFDSLQRKSVILSSDSNKSSKKYNVLDQRAAIQKINENTQLLKQELAIEFRESKAVLDPTKLEKLKELQARIASFGRKIEVEKKRIARLDATLASKTNALRASQKSTGSIDEARANAAANVRRLQSLENKLENALCKKSEAESENKLFLEKISLVNKDRVIFDSIYKQLEKEVYDATLALNNATESLEKVTAAKDAVVAELEELQAYAVTEQDEYEAAFKSLKSAIEESQAEATERVRQLALLPEDQHVSGELSFSQEQQIDRIAARASWKLLGDKTLLTRYENRLDEYGEVFEQIYKTTHLKDAAEIAETLVTRDNENFNQFKRVEALNREVKECQEIKDKLVMEMEETATSSSIGGGMASNNNNPSSEKQFIKGLNKKLQALRESNASLDASYEEWSSDQSRIKSTLLTIYNILAQNEEGKDEQKQPARGVALPKLNLTSSGGGVTDTNILEVLAAVEAYATELLVLQQECNEEEKTKNDDSSADIPPLLLGVEGPGVLAKNSESKNEGVLNVSLPSVEDMEDENVIVEPRPLTMEELLLQQQQQL